MSVDTGNTGGKQIFNSIKVTASPRERRVGRLVFGYTGWFLALFVLFSYLGSAELRETGRGILWWLAVYVAYILILEVLSRRLSTTYDTKLFRMLRIQLGILFSSALVFLAAGSQIPFWVVYLWPIFATAAYFGSRRLSLAVYCEAAILYLLSAIAATGGLPRADLLPLLANILIMLVLSALFHFLMESIRSHQAAEIEIERFEKLQAIQDDIDTAIDMQAVLDRILQGAVELVNARDGSLMLIEQGELHFRSRHGNSSADKLERTFKRGEGIAGRVLATRRPYVCPDTARDKYFIPITGGMPIRSLVSVPIVSHGSVLGVINVDSQEVGHFSATDAQVLVTLATQTAAAIERAELWDSLRQMGEQALDAVEPLYQRVVDSVHRLTRVPVAIWQLSEKNRGQATISAHRGLRPQYTETRVLDLDASVTGRAIRDAVCIEVEDIQQDLEVSPQTKVEAEEEGWKSLLVVPLLAGPKQAVGTISVYNLVKKRFAPWEIDRLRTFASQAAVSLKNAERLQTIRRLGQIGQSLATLQGSPEVLQETLKRIANAAVEELGADTVDLYEYEADNRTFVLPPVMTGKRRFPDLVPQEILSDDVVFKIAQSGEAIYASDAQSDRTLADDWKEPRGQRPEERFVVREQIVSSATVPVKIGQELVGVLFVSYRQRRDFDADSSLREKIEAFVNFAGVAIRNARLLQQERTLRQQAETLREVSSAISAELGLTETAMKILTELERVIPYKKASMQLIKGNSRSLVAYRGLTEPNTAWLLRPLSEDSLITEVVTSQRPVILPVVTDYQDWEILPETADVKSWVGLPLVYGQDTIGVLTLDHDQPGFYSNALENQLVPFGYQAAIAMNNANLVQEMSLLQKVGAKVSATLDLEELLSLLVQGAIDLIDVRSGVVHVFDAKGEKILESFGYPKSFSHPAPRITEDGYTRHIIKTRQRVVVRDAQEDTKANPEVVQKGVRSFVGTPLILRDERIIGVLYLNDHSVRKFTHRELSLLRTLADQAAIAIEHATLVDRLKKERQERIEAIREIGFGVTTGVGKRKVLHDLLNRTLGLMKEASLGEIWLLADSGDRLRVEAVQGSVATDINELRVGDGIVGRVALTGEAHLTKEVDSDPYFVRRLAGTQSELAVPLLRGDRLIGVLNVEHPQPDAFSADDIPLLAAIGSQVVIALDNAGLYQHLHESLEHRIQELEVLTEIGRTISNLGIDQILEQIYSQASRIMDARNIQIAFYDEDTDAVEFPYARSDGKRVEVGVGDFAPRKRGIDRYGLTEYVIEHGEAEFSAGDVWEWADERHIELSRNIPTKAWIGTPLKIWDRERQVDKVIGLISIQSYEKENAYEDNDLRVLETIAHQAAVAIENARLYAQLESAFEEAESARRRAESARASLRAMAGGYVHRLNGALGFIPSSIDAIIGDVDADAQDVLRDAKGGVKDALEFTARMTDLVVDQELPRENVNVELMLKTVVHKFVHIFKILPGEVSWELAPDLPEIMADTMFLTEVFNNLILNALEAMENTPERELRIGGHLTDTGHVQIWLSDKGCGILEENLSEIFEPEYTTKPGKRGLGLWFCNTVIQAHSGRIDVDSKPGEGTTFTITLPVGG